MDGFYHIPFGFQAYTANQNPTAGERVDGLVLDEVGNGYMAVTSNRMDYNGTLYQSRRHRYARLHCVSPDGKLVWACQIAHDAGLSSTRIARNTKGEIFLVHGQKVFHFNAGAVKPRPKTFDANKARILEPTTTIDLDLGFAQDVRTDPMAMILAGDKVIVCGGAAINGLDSTYASKPWLAIVSTAKPMSRVSTKKTFPNFTKLTGMCLHPDGAHVYVTGIGKDAKGRIAKLRLEPASIVSSKEIRIDAVDVTTPTSILCDPDGAVYVCGYSNKGKLLSDGTTLKPWLARFPENLTGEAVIREELAATNAAHANTDQGVALALALGPDNRVHVAGSVGTLGPPNKIEQRFEGFMASFSFEDTVFKRHTVHRFSRRHLSYGPEETHQKIDALAFQPGPANDEPSFVFAGLSLPRGQPSAPVAERGIWQFADIFWARATLKPQPRVLHELPNDDGKSDVARLHALGPDTVILGGSTTGQMARTPTRKNHPPHGDCDVWIAAIDPTAQSSPLKWVTQFGTWSDDRMADLAVNGDFVFSTGMTRGDLVRDRSNEGRQDGWIAVHKTTADSVSQHQVLQFSAIDGDVSPRGLLVHAPHLFVAGMTNGRLDGQPAVRDGHPHWLMRFTIGSDGRLSSEPDWTRQFGAGELAAVTGLALDHEGKPMVHGTLMLGAETDENGFSSGVWAMGFSTDAGTERWRRRLDLGPPQSLSDALVHGTMLLTCGHSYVQPPQGGDKIGVATVKAFDLSQPDQARKPQWSRSFEAKSHTAAARLALSKDKKTLLVVGETASALSQDAPNMVDGWVAALQADTGDVIWQTQLRTGASPARADEAIGGLCVSETSLFVAGSRSDGGSKTVPWIASMPF